MKSKQAETKQVFNKTQEFKPNQADKTLKLESKPDNKVSVN